MSVPAQSASASSLGGVVVVFVGAVAVAVAVTAAVVGGGKSTMVGANDGLEAGADADADAVGVEEALLSDLLKFFILEKNPPAKAPAAPATAPAAPPALSNTSLMGGDGIGPLAFFPAAAFACCFSSCC